MAAAGLKNDRATIATNDCGMEDADPDKGINHSGIFQRRRRLRAEGRLI